MNGDGTALLYVPGLKAPQIDRTTAPPVLKTANEDKTSNSGPTNSDWSNTAFKLPPET